MRDDMMAEREVLLTLASEIVSAHISNNDVAREQLPALIQQVYDALATAGQKAVEPTRPDPVVPIRQSVRPEHLVCLECGKHFSMLKRHLMTDHELTPEQYRIRWGLPPSYPVVAPNYAKVRSTLAKKIGLGRRPPMKKTASGRGRG
jgi:predicted transcriptional regulator